MKYITLDIETAREFPTLEDCPEPVQKLWDWYCKKKYPEDEDYPKLYKEKTGLSSTFARIVCISCSFQVANGEVRTKSFHNESENDLLVEFANMLFESKNYGLCGHNIKRFDLPFIVQRMWKYGIEIPSQLRLWDKKPWEFNVLDTMEVFSLNNFGSHISLHEMCSVLGVPTPKDGIDGSMVGDAYHEGRIKEIVEYCEKDTTATVLCAKEMTGK